MKLQKNKEGKSPPTKRLYPIPKDITRVVKKPPNNSEVIKERSLSIYMVIKWIQMQSKARSGMRLIRSKLC